MHVNRKFFDWRSLMKSISAILSLIHLSSFSVYAVDPPAAYVEAALARRKEIPLGGDFKPDPKLPVFVAVGHGVRILLSRDDGHCGQDGLPTYFSRPMVATTRTDPFQPVLNVPR